MAALSGQRILLLSYYFPPLASAGGHRTGALARHLSELGAEVTVITVKHGLDVDDPALLANLPPAVAVRRVSSLEGAVVRRRLRDRVKHERLKAGESVDRATAGSPAEESTEPSGVQRALMALAWGLSAARVAQPWALRRAIYGVMALRAVRREIRRNRPDVVIASLGPMCQSWAALLGARGSGVPVVLDFRDLWTTAPEYFTSLRGYAIGRPAYLIDRLTERWALRRADWFIANHEHMQGSLERLTPRAFGRVTVIPNGYEEDDFAALPAAGVNRATTDGVVTIRSTGTTYIYTAKSLLDACERLPAAAAARLRIELIGPWYDLVSQLERTERMAVTSVLPPRPHAEALKAMANADVLLFLLRDMAGIDDMIPARLYE
ncbi:MAG: glycosyltransferase, partial [Thermoleophilia bacterium]|nr:glycosyltransferase [Thermoleophilia bacterium]